MKYSFAIWTVLSDSKQLSSELTIGNINVHWKETKCKSRIFKLKYIYIKPNIRVWKEQCSTGKYFGYKFSV